MAKKRKAMINRLLLAALVFLALAANAYSKEDFSLTAQSSVSLCSCAAQSYRISIKNTGNDASAYDIQPASNVQSIIKINPSKFSLKPNQRTEFQAIVNAPCDTSGSLAAQIIVRTDKGLVKALNQKYEIKECFSYTIAKGRILSEIKAKIEPEVYDGSYEICENTESFVPLFFSNKDSRDNSYQLSVEGADWAVPPVKEFSIKAKKSAVALIQLNPSAESEGSYQIKANSVSTIGSVENSALLDVNVSKCYEIGIEVEKKEGVLCGGDKEKYEVKLLNKGRFDEDIGLEVEGIEWLSPTEESVNVKAGETKAVSINAMPPSETEGKFNAELSAFIVKTPEVRSGKESIEVEVKPKSECYKGEIIGKGNIRTSYSGQFVNFRVRNGGERSAKYKLFVDGPGWISAEPSELCLEPGQFFNANIRLNPSEDVAEGEYDAEIKLNHDDAEYSKQIKVNLKKRNPAILWAVGFYKFYKYYVYLAIVLLIILFLYRNRIKEKYKRYRTRKARINALKKARMARAALRPKKEVKISKAEKKKSRKFWLYPAIAIIIAAAGIFGRKYAVAYAIYAKDFVLAYIIYILLGIAIAAVIVFMIEFYKPLFRMLKKK